MSTRPEFVACGNEEAQIRTDAGLIILQTRLYSPGYAGPGRWVIFQPRSRQAFNAIGSDVVPDVVTILSAAAGGVTKSQLLATTNVTRLQLDGLIKRRLLVEEQAGHTPLETFTQHYQLASYSYPFHDYFEEDWREKEENLLRHYDELWPPPPATRDRQGVFRPLPDVDLSDLAPSRNASEMQWIAAMLRFTFGAIGEIKTSRVTCLRRTSPSGGARHPTEGKLLLPDGLEGIPAGCHVYDVRRHGLVEQADQHASALALRSIARFGVAICSRVDRAMWRYRDLRAWRPVLIDAGHIIETISLLSARRGIPIETITPPPESFTSFDWLEEPAVAVVAALDKPLIPSWRWPVATTESTFHERTDECRTNPASFMTFRPGGLRHHVLWPKGGRLDTDLVDFRILSHCLPSKRGDRDTTDKGILMAVSGSTPSHIANLRHSGALLPATQADALYSAAGLWIRHGWYLSMLERLETAAALDRPVVSSSIRSRDFLGALHVMETRRTQRSFSAEAIGRVTLETLLRRVLAPSLGDNLRIAVVAQNVEGLDQGQIYRLNEALSFEAPVSGITSHEARRIAVGQAPVEGAAAVILLGVTARCHDPRLYEIDIMTLGRLGQRICLIAEEMGIGVFLTPALNDDLTFQALNMPQIETGIGYLFALGKRNAR